MPVSERRLSGRTALVTGAAPGIGAAPVNASAAGRVASHDVAGSSPVTVYDEAARQPSIHDQVICVAAPALAISGVDGQIRGAGAQGVYVSDRRVVSLLTVRFGGASPEAVGSTLIKPWIARFVGLCRSDAEPAPDPVVTIERLRDVRTLAERLTVHNYGTRAVKASLEIDIGTDLASMLGVRAGWPSGPCSSSAITGGLRFHGPGIAVTVTALPHPERVPSARDCLCWALDLAPGTEWSAELRIGVTGVAAPVAPARGVPWRRPEVTCADVRVGELVRRSLDDLQALLVADPAHPADEVLAAGSPWYLTLFGRDSLWAARMMLPLGTGLAAATLRALARRQGRRVDDATDEAPGKIPHELRAKGSGLPELSFSTIDATPLFVTLLADAWRWGLPDSDVAALLPAAERALSWLGGEVPPDGFLSYVHRGAGGLVNQGWKDSADAIRHSDGGRAKPPIALCEVQAYAYEAAVRGAGLLNAFGRPGAGRWLEWAAALRERFRAAFWRDDHVVIALDRDGRPVDSIASNMGHALGTGILSEAEEHAVARCLATPEMASGWGLRTLSSASPAFNPFGYHTGSVWAHDTAITALGLSRCGHGAQAAELLRGLVEAAPYFGYRLPELYGGEQRAAGHAPLPYPAACRPQAWSAAAAIALLTVLTGLDPDVPGGRLTVRPLRPAPFGSVELRGVLAGAAELTIRIGPAGDAGVSAPGLTVTVE